MKREIEFIKSMTEKLRWQGDVSANEAARIFLLAIVTYAYEMGELEGRYKNNFGGKFDYTGLSSALREWYEIVFARISDKPKYYNFIASIPSREVCPVSQYMEGNTSFMIKAMDKLQDNKRRTLQRIFKTSEHVYFSANKKMAVWIKRNVPLSFDMLCYYGVHGSNYSDMDFARFGLLDALPTYERKIEKKKLQMLFDIDIPFLRSVSNEKEVDICSVICPIEYKDVLNAIADNLPIPEIPQEKASAHVPKDIKYINLLTDRLPFQDITEEEADNIYLLFKVYQALRIAALKGDERLKEQVQKTTEPGLNALASWYKAVGRELKKGKRGNFVYTLPSNLDMNLYQLRKPIERCLETLPKEPPEVVTRYEDRLSVKDTLLDTKCTKVTGVSDKYIRYRSSRYGFFKRNDIDLEQWKPVIRCRECAGDDIFDRSLGIPILGKLRFAEFSLGIKQVVMGDVVAVKEEDYQKMLEVLKLSDSKIMEIAEFLVQKELEEIWAEREKLAKTPENHEKLDVLERRESILKRKSGIPLEHVIKGVETAYKAQRDREEYLDEGEWMEMNR